MILTIKLAVFEDEDGFSHQGLFGFLTAGMFYSVNERRHTAEELVLLCRRCKIMKTGIPTVRPGFVVS